MASLDRAAIVLVLGACLAGPAGAQSEVRFGVQLGGNLARERVDWDEPIEGLKQKFQPGFQVGLVAQVGAGAVSFMPAAVITQKGDRFEIVSELSQGTFRASGKSRVTYLQAPLLVMARLRPADRRGGPGPFLYGGPAIAIELSCSRSSRIDYGDFSEAVDSEPCIDESDGQRLRKKAELGLIGGIGVEIGPASLALQYDHGVTNLADGSESTPYRNRTLSFVVRGLLGRG